MAPAIPPLPYVDLKAQYERLRPLIDENIRRVLDHGQYILGPEIGELERLLAELVGGGEAIAVSNGTDALLMALMAHRVGPGDAVFAPSFTFTATAEVPLLLGATPVFVDIVPGRYSVCPKSLEEEIERVLGQGRLRPKVVIAVDLFGLPAEYPAIEKVTGPRGLTVIADAAQSLGAKLGSVSVGRLAPLSTTSFYPAKPLGCYGDGGALFTEDAGLAECLRSIRVHGEGGERYDIVRLGVNGRLDTLQAAILLAKLTVFEEELERREALARFYDARLGDELRVPQRPVDCRSAWAQYTVEVEGRDRVRTALRERGIPTGVYYPLPMHLQPAYRPYGRGEGSLEVSEAVAKRVLSLPMHPYLADADAERVCSGLLAALAAPAPG